MSKCGRVATLLSGSHSLCSDTVLESCQITTVVLVFLLSLWSPFQVHGFLSCVLKAPSLLQI